MREELRRQLEAVPEARDFKSAYVPADERPKLRQATRSFVMSFNRDALLVLLQASSKKAADVFLGVAFLDLTKRCPQRKLEAARAILPIEAAEFDAAFESAKTLIAESLRRGADHAVIEELLGAEFHPQLRELFTKIILANAPVWTEVLVQDQVSLPRLIDVNWRVDVVASSSTMSRQARPTVRDQTGLL